MRIIINSAIQRFGGAIQVAYSFIHECKKFDENEYHVFLGTGLKKLINKSEFPENFIFYEFDFGVITFWKTFKVNNKLKELEDKIKPDCIIATSGPTYFHSRAPQIVGYNLGLYIYPESPYVKQLSIYRKIRYLIKRKLHFIFFKRDAKAFVVQTDDVNVRVRNALNTNLVYTVTNNHNGYYYEWQKFPLRLPLKQDRIRFLTISDWYAHKNLDIIPKVIEVLKSKGVKDFDFVVTLEEGKYREHFKNADKNHLINVGPVKPFECPSLYNECDYVFLPTLAECFSASYPEAMIMNKPIITTDLGFAKSICKDAAIYYEPQNPNAAAEAIMRIISNKELTQELVDNGKKQVKKFDTPEERARKYLSICRDIIDIK